MKGKEVLKVIENGIKAIDTEFEREDYIKNYDNMSSALERLTKLYVEFKEVYGE